MATLKQLFILVFASLAAAQTPFGSGLYQVMQQAGCPGCHKADGVAAGTRIHFPGADATPEKIEAFGRSLVTVVDRANPQASLLLNKPTNRIAHAGGERIKPGSTEEVILKGWIEVLTKLDGEALKRALQYREIENAGDGQTSARTGLRRLTHSQYNNTVRDLLGDQTAPADQFPPEDFINGYRNQSGAQSLSPLLIEAYSIAAERLARNAFRAGDSHHLIPCQPSAACRVQFVRDFGAKAFRRPLGPAEQKRYQSLFTQEPKDFRKGAQLVVEAMLQSPNFLFRLEATDNPLWKPYGAASRISYALWDTMPDAALFAAATGGQLATASGVSKNIRRMLDNPRAHEALNEFVSQWLRFDRILNAAKDRRKYPQFNKEVAVSMTEEARLFFSDLVWRDRNFMDLFTGDYAFVNADLAPLYGLKVPEKEFERVTFPPESERAGLTGQALFLALTAKPEDSSPTARGLFVRQIFLCQAVPDPPPGVNTTLPPVTEAQPQTNRERMTEHASNPTCKTCHTLIDSIGFGFEKFDAVGARRETLALQFPGTTTGDSKARPPMKTINLPLDTTGEVAGIPNSKFSSPRELGAILAQSAQCQECMAKQYFRYVMGRLETAADRPIIRKMTDDFRASGFHFRELMVSLLLSRENFVNSRK